jgi:hypothetical protein
MIDLGDTSDRQEGYSKIIHTDKKGMTFARVYTKTVRTYVI